MNIKQQADLISSIEEKFPVDEWVIDGIHVWPIIRWRIFLLLRKQNLRNNTRREKKLLYAVSVSKNIPRKIAKYLYASWRDFKHNDKLNRKTDVIFLTHSTCRQLPIRGRKFDIFIDPLAAKLKERGMTSLVLEMAPNDLYLIPRYNKSVFILLNIYLIDWWTRFISKSDGVKLLKLPGFEDFLDFLYNKAKLVINPEGIECEVRFINKLSNYYEAIIRKTKPSLGIAVTYYDRYVMPFILACKRNNIPFVDIQHGAQGDLHPAYGRWNRVPAHGYELLPSIFWCWSELEAQAIERWSSKVSQYRKPLVGGNLYLNMFTNPDDAIPRYFKGQVLQKVDPKASVCLLVTLQTGIGLTALIKNLMKAAPSAWFWWIRLHPGMQDKKREVSVALTSLGVKNYYLDANMDLPLYSILPNMNVHLTYLSTVVIEAGYFGIPSVILSSDGEHRYIDQIKCGSVMAAYDVPDVIAAVKSLILKKGMLAHSTNLDFRPEALERLLSWTRKDVSQCEKKING